MGKLKKIKTDPTFFKFISTCIRVSFIMLRIIVVRYEAVILPIKDFCLTSLKFRGSQLRITKIIVT